MSLAKASRHAILSGEAARVRGASWWWPTCGGEMVSTWSEDRWLHAEIPPLSLNGGKKISDEANFALAA